MAKCTHTATTSGSCAVAQCHSRLEIALGGYIRGLELEMVCSAVYSVRVYDVLDQSGRRKLSSTSGGIPASATYTPHTK